MMIFVWIIVSIIVFSIIVLLHEYWHFKRARIFGVKVEEFWLWIPPKAKTIYTDKKWTIYTINWLPLWGFVKLKWDDSNETKNNDKDSLVNISAWKASIIILAWVFMNFILAFVIFTTLFFIWVSPIWINQKIENDYNLKIIPTFDDAIKLWVLIEKPWVFLWPLKWSIAYESWIRENDILLKINNTSINSYKEVSNIIKENKEKNMIFEIKREICKDKKCETKNININVIPNKEWKIWVYIWPNIEVVKDFKYSYSLVDSVKYWFLETYGQIKLTFKALWILVQKIFNPKDELERKEAINSLSWPIWIADLITNSISNWIIFIVIIWAIISINLWVFNLLPIPALDWWRFVFIIINWTIQKIFKRKIINYTLENILHLWFFIILITLSIFIAYNDVYKIINR